MTASTPQPLFSRRTSNGSSEDRTYESVYRVQTDDKLDGPITAANAVMAYIGGPGAPYQWGNDTDGLAFAYPHPAATQEQPDNQGARKFWRVTVIYSTRSFPTCREESYDSPLDMPARWSGSFVERLKIAKEDINGAPVANSADEPFFPAPEIDDPTDTLRVTFNTASIDLALRASFRGRTNETEWRGLAARTVRMRQWAWEPQVWGACFHYVAHTIELEINTDKFNERRLDEGFRTKAVAGGVVTYSPILDASKRPITSPHPLDGGAKLSNADIIAGNFEYIESEVIKEAEFNDLPIPDFPPVIA